MESSDRLELRDGSMVAPGVHGKLLLIDQPGHCKVPPGSVMGLTHQQLNLECGMQLGSSHPPPLPAIHVCVPVPTMPCPRWQPG